VQAFKQNGCLIKIDNNKLLSRLQKLGVRRDKATKPYEYASNLKDVLRILQAMPDAARLCLAVERACGKMGILLETAPLASALTTGGETPSAPASGYEDLPEDSMEENP
jgi:hypothetical protein